MRGVGPALCALDAPLILLILTIAKMFLNPVSFYTSIKSPVGLSLFSSFPMSLIMISVWMKELFDKANLGISMTSYATNGRPLLLPGSAPTLCRT